MVDHGSKNALDLTFLQSKIPSTMKKEKRRGENERRREGKGVNITLFCNYLLALVSLAAIQRELVIKKRFLRIHYHGVTEQAATIITQLIF